MYTQAHSYRKISRSLGRKNKVQNVILPFVWRIDLINHGQESLSFVFLRSDSRQHRSSITAEAERKQRRGFSRSRCCTPDSAASCLLSLRAYWSVRVTCFETRKCLDCRHICPSASCSPLFSHVYMERLNHVGEHPPALGLDHLCCRVIPNVSAGAEVQTSSPKRFLSIALAQAREYSWQTIWMWPLCRGRQFNSVDEGRSLPAGLRLGHEPRHV